MTRMIFEGEGLVQGYMLNHIHVRYDGVKCSGGDEGESSCGQESSSSDDLVIS